LTGNAALRPTFTEVGHLTAFVVGLAAVPLAPGREGMPYPGPIRAAPEERLRCPPQSDTVGEDPY